MASLSLLAVSGAATLRADFKDFSNRCSPGAIRACASIQVHTVLNSSGGTNVRILVRNLQGWTGGTDNTGGSIITRIGLTAPAPMTGATGLTVAPFGAGVVGSAKGWTLAQQGGQGGPIELTAGPGQSPWNTFAGGIVGCDNPSDGLPDSHYRTCSGGWVELTFTTTNAWSANDAQVAWLTQHAMNSDGASGFECSTDAAGGQDSCEVVTPEPFTILLLGSGLAGLGGVGAFKRRRGNSATGA